jgi:hypothetical protein
LHELDQRPDDLLWLIPLDEVEVGTRVGSASATLVSDHAQRLLEDFILGNDDLEPLKILLRKFNL